MSHQVIIGRMTENEDTGDIWMRFQRKSILAVVATLSLLFASSASALSFTQNIGGVFTSGFLPSATAVIGPNSITNLNVGDIILLSYDVENGGGDLITAIFNTLTFNTTSLSLFGGTFVPAILFVAAVPFPPAPSQSLGSIGAGPVIKIASGPAFDQIQAMAFASGAGSVGLGPNLSAATVFLEVIAPGAFDLNFGFFFSNDLVSINGQTFAGTDVTGIGGVTVNAPTIAIAIVPEPGTALLMGLGLAGLAAAGRRR
jgi:hypothetical protein